MNQIRKLFPFLSHSTYLDTPSNGLLSTPLLEWRKQQDADFLNNPNVFRTNHKKVLSDTKEIIADVFDAQTDDIALIPNFSFGLNMVLEGFEKRQKVLLLSNDYPSVNWSVENRDFEIQYAEIDEVLEKNIETAIERFRPDIFIFSIVQWLTGIKIDFEFLKKLKSAYPDLLLIGDGTQYLGIEKFSFENSGLDVLVTSGYKWLTAGFGNGFLIIRKSARTKIKVKTIGFNSSPDFDSNRNEIPYMNHFEPGHLNSVNFGSIGFSLQLMDSFGANDCYRQIEMLSKSVKEILTKMDMLEPDVVKRDKHSSIFKLKNKSGLADLLLANQISNSPRGGGFRVGFHYYNNENDLDRLTEVLKKL